MTDRTVGTSDYDLVYDAENRLVDVSGSADAEFVYDGDGNRVKGTAGGTTTVYIGAAFEWTGSTSTMKRYYYAGTVRIAVRVGSGTGTTGLSWLLGDHLGSTSLTVSLTAVKTGELRYKPYGETRFSYGSTPTTFKFTGQREQVEIGLYYFQARWFDSALGRFVSADSIIPEPGSPLSWDRYLYTHGNPLKYTDPSGHEVCDEEGNCLDGGKYRKVNGQTQVDWWAKLYGIKFTKNWINQNKISVLSTVIRVGYKFADTLNNGMTAWGAFRGVYGTLTFALSSETQEYWAQYGGGTITYYAGAQQWATLTAHELGHAFNARIANNSGTTPYNTLFNQGIWLDDGRQLAGYMRGHTVSGTGFTCNGQKCVDSEGNPIPANHYWRQNDGFGFSHSKDLTANEDFADMFGNWAVGSFPNDDAGVARLNFMTTNMSEWIHSAMGR